MAAPASLYFSTPELKRHPAALVYGPPHLLRAAWLAGVLDYLKEPWEPEELFLRLRGPRAAAVSWTFQGRELRLEGHAISTAAQTVRLSITEAELLRLLVKRRGTAVPRHVLAWAAGCSERRVVDTLMARLRRKLAALEEPGARIVAVRGVGYTFP